MCWESKTILNRDVFGRRWQVLLWCPMIPRRLWGWYSYPEEDNGYPVSPIYDAICFAWIEVRRFRG